MAPAKSVDPKDLLTGGVLQCIEAGTLGLPFEVWKTHMGTYRKQTTMEAFRNVYAKGGVKAFWSGWQPKLVESFLKGGILLFAKDAVIRSMTNFGASEVTAGLVGGFAGGCAQVVVMGPCTFLVTAAVTGDKSISFYQRSVDVYKSRGIGGFYQGGTALLLRQGSNWASRQGLTDIVRELLKKRHVHDGASTKDVKLSVAEEAMSGIIGGALSTWNQPFEVLRIEAQASAAKGLPPRNIVQTCKHIVSEAGVLGLFQGVLPRMGLCIWQTLFLVQAPRLLKTFGI
eukprot:CAMPEP_0184975744 /NCGR_PEP_ID=MMETSP1098-20130426/6891_1 /TAXON_ID=89044 /ORGANISM="Spumella elongata, Strain CCAP 955/1" /LENGTH=284 /DNA_ID=CAMNT_0027498515 /DNA_START=36 /DNA_END=890 /DNA_ORIENTATION=-